jgi:hypothetical protein
LHSVSGVAQVLPMQAPGLFEFFWQSASQFWYNCVQELAVGLHPSCALEGFARHPAKRKSDVIIPKRMATSPPFLSVLKF